MTLMTNEFVKFYIRRIDDASRELARYKQGLVAVYVNEIYEELKGKPSVNLTDYVIDKSNTTGLYDAIRGLEHSSSLDINEIIFAIEIEVGARLNADKQSQ